MPFVGSVHAVLSPNAMSVILAPFEDQIPEVWPPGTVQYRVPKQNSPKGFW